MIVFHYDYELGRIPVPPVVGYQSTLADAGKECMQV